MSRKTEVAQGRQSKTSKKRHRKMTAEKKLRMAKYRESHAEQAERSRGLDTQRLRASENNAARQQRRQKRREEEEQRRQQEEKQRAAAAAAAAQAEQEKKSSQEAAES